MYEECTKTNLNLFIISKLLILQKLYTYLMNLLTNPYKTYFMHYLDISTPMDTGGLSFRATFLTHSNF